MMLRVRARPRVVRVVPDMMGRFSITVENITAASPPRFVQYREANGTDNQEPSMTTKTMSSSHRLTDRQKAEGVSTASRM